MRVFCLEDSKIGNLETFEIVDIGFDDDIYGIKDDNGEYDRFENQCETGLYMIDKDDNYICIKNISLSECNKICKAIGKDGYYDLSSYGEYEVIEND